MFGLAGVKKRRRRWKKKKKKKNVTLADSAVLDVGKKKMKTRSQISLDVPDTMAPAREEKEELADEAQEDEANLLRLMERKKRLMVLNSAVTCLILVLMVLTSSFLGSELGSAHWMHRLVNQTLQSTVDQLDLMFTKRDVSIE